MATLDDKLKQLAQLRADTAAGALAQAELERQVGQVQLVVAGSQLPAVVLDQDSSCLVLRLPRDVAAALVAGWLPGDVSRCADDASYARLLAAVQQIGRAL